MAEKSSVPKKEKAKASLSPHQRALANPLFHPLFRFIELIGGPKLDEGKKSGRSIPASASPHPSPTSPSSSIHSFLRESAKLFLLCVLVTLLLMAALVLVSNPLVPRPSWKWAAEETPLQKNVALPIRPGDTLVYELTSASGPQSVTLQASQSAYCPNSLLLADTTTSAQQYGSLLDAVHAQPGVYAVCLGSDGQERSPACLPETQNPGFGFAPPPLSSSPSASHPTNSSCPSRVLGSNLSFENVTWPYFAPWMLALSPNFEWEANLSLQAQPTNLSSKTKLTWRVVNVTQFEGREAYLVRVDSQTLPGSILSMAQSSSSPPSALDSIFLLVDAQYRVLLYTQSPSTSIRLVQAPFALDLNDTAAASAWNVG